MEASRIRALRGPNLWSRHTAIQAIVTCEGAECAISELPQFEARLRERFPELGDLIPSDHLDTVSMAHALEFAALGLSGSTGARFITERIAEDSRESLHTRLGLARRNIDCSRLPDAALLWDGETPAGFGRDFAATGEILVIVAAPGGPSPGRDGCSVASSGLFCAP